MAKLRVTTRGEPIALGHRSGGAGAR
jgi:hypothetical protein